MRAVGAAAVWSHEGGATPATGDGHGTGLGHDSPRKRGSLPPLKPTQEPTQSRASGSGFSERNLGSRGTARGAWAATPSECDAVPHNDPGKRAKLLIEGMGGAAGSVRLG